MPFASFYWLCVEDVKTWRAYQFPKNPPRAPLHPKQSIIISPTLVHPFLLAPEGLSPFHIPVCPAKSMDAISGRGKAGELAAATYAA